MKKSLIAFSMLSAFVAMPALAHDADMMFSKIDTNNDGKISADEHAAYAQKKFEAADTNGDGYVSPAELKAAKMKEHSCNGKASCHGKTQTNMTTNPHPTKGATSPDTNQ